MSDESLPDAGGAPSQANELISQITPEAAVDPTPTEEPAAKPAGNRTIAYAILSVGLGLLAGGGFASMAMRPAGRTGALDLGQVSFSPAGLKGHLALNWNKKLEYSLAVEPSDPARSGEFARVIATSPRPLSVGIQLKDADGYVLCMKTIQLKFDPAQAAPSAQLGSLPSPAAELERREAQEAARERGQDLFQNQAGPDGEVRSIRAAGEIPCSNQDYASAASWTFSPDFPSLDEQADLNDRQTGAGATADETAASHKASVHRKAKKKAAEQQSAFAIEGDDELVGIDAARGVARTTTSITFLLSQASARDAASRLQEMPTSIHYRCDLNNACTITHGGAVVLSAQLRR